MTAITLHRRQMEYIQPPQNSSQVSRPSVPFVSHCDLELHTHLLKLTPPFLVPAHQTLFNRQEIQPSPLALLAATCSKIGQGFEAPNTVLQSPINQLAAQQDYAASWVSEHAASSHANDGVYHSSASNVLQAQNHSNPGLYTSLGQVENGQMYYTAVTTSPAGQNVCSMPQQTFVTNGEANVNLVYTPEYDLTKAVDSGAWAIKSDAGEGNAAVAAQWWQGKPLSWAKNASSPSHQYVVSSPTYTGNNDVGIPIMAAQQTSEASDNNAAQNPAYVQVTRTPQGQIILTQESTEPNKWLPTGTVNVIAAPSNATNGNGAIQVQVQPEASQETQIYKRSCVERKCQSWKQSQAFAGLPALVRIAEKAKGGRLMAENSIFVTYQAAGKCTGRHRICERIFAGTRASDRSSATGCFAGNDSLVLTNCSGIAGLTQEKSDLRVKNAARGLCEAIIYQNM